MGIGTGIFLLAVGAILRYAVTITTSGINLHTVGDILMVVGLIGIVLSLFFWSSWGGFGGGGSGRGRGGSVIDRRTVIERDPVVQRHTVIERDPVIQRQTVVERDPVVERRTVIERDPELY